MDAFMLSEIAECALLLVGKPYKWGGATPKGFDCTGLISYCYSRFGPPLFHHTARDLLRYCEVLEEPVVGGFAFRKRFSRVVGKPVVDHVGIVVSETEVVSSWRHRGVTLDSISGFNVFAELKSNYRAPRKLNYLDSQPDYSKVRDVLEEELNRRWKEVGRDSGF